MKNIFILTILTTLLFSSMIGEPHDLSSDTATSEDELCIHCHQSYDANIIIPPYNEGATVSEEFVNATTTCLECHDGISASSQHIFAAVIESNKVDPEAGHPVFMSYINGTYNLKHMSTNIYNWDNANTINDLLVNGQLKCISCHNPHNNKHQTYLRSTNKESHLCKSCH